MKWGLSLLKKAANSTTLHAAFDQLAGKDNWLPRETLGSFLIRFPTKAPAIDTGWHVDANFPGAEAHNYFEWRVNINSKGRALLMLFLFPEVAKQVTPTIIRVGSHLDVAKILAPEGEKGLSFMELAQKIGTLPMREETWATEKQEQYISVHPFLVHAAQDHRGTSPKFMAQPPLLTKNEFKIRRAENECCPVETAIVTSLKE